MKKECICDQFYPRWPRPPSPVTNTWPSKLLFNLNSQPLSVCTTDTKSHRILYKRLFFFLLLEADSCELGGHVRTSPPPVGTSESVWRQRSTPCWLEAALSALHTAVVHTPLLHSHSCASPRLYSEVTLRGRFAAIGAIIAIIWLSPTNLSPVILLLDQFLEQDVSYLHF